LFSMFCRFTVNLQKSVTNVPFVQSVSEIRTILDFCVDIYN